MEFGLSLMDLVSSCSKPGNQAIRTMHSQGNSASLSQQSHMRQSLANMHTNTNAAHSYSSQHPFSLSMSGAAGPFINQNSEQAPASNHPVANSSTVGQSYNLQKSNNTTSVPGSQPHSLTPVQSIASVAPHIADPPPPEKSQANGTSEGEPPQLPFAQGFSLVTKDKPRIPTPPSPQAMEIEPVLQGNVIETSSLPVSAKTDNTESPTSKPSPDVSNAKPTQEASTPKKADSPTTSSFVTVQPKKSVSPTVAASEKEQDPLLLPEREKSEPPEEIGSSGTKIEATKKEEPKVGNDFHKKAGAVKLKNPEDESVKAERAAQKGVSEAKPVTHVKATPRKAKSAASQGQEQKPVATSTPSASGVGAAKRQRIRTQHYQSPLPEVEFISKISTSSLKNYDEKLIVFYKNEFLAVRNAEGGFYLCQAVQNIYKSSPKIRIRWLSQDKTDQQGEVYSPDFYDLIDFDCILTNLSLTKAEKGKFRLPPSEKTRTESILNRSLAVEKGEEISSPSLTEEHPDGLDLSLYRDEDQIKKRKARKRNRKISPVLAPKETPTKKSPKALKVRKVVPPVKESSKKVAPKKPAPPTKKIAPPAEPKPTTSGAKLSKGTSKVISKPSTKTSPVVDQKKAKVLARIGKKTAVATPTKSAKNNSKNGKSGIKAVGSSNKKVQPKASSSGSVKTSIRSVRKSTRK